MSRKVLIILYGLLWEVELTYRYIFAFKFTLRSQQPDIVLIICHIGVIDTGRKFAAGIVSLIPVVRLDMRISLQIFE